MATARGFAEPFTLRDGRAAVLRAIRPDDRERLAAAFLALEPESVYLRYFSYKHELTPADLDRLCVPDFRERVVLVATIGNADGEVIIGSGGYVVHPVADGARAAEMLQVFARSGLPMEREAEEDGVVRVTLRLA
jgi:hypothetical protein